jgi:hypothetical protein
VRGRGRSKGQSGDGVRGVVWVVWCSYSTAVRSLSEDEDGAVHCGWSASTGQAVRTMLDANSDREGCMRYWTCNLYVCARVL